MKPLQNGLLCSGIGSILCGQQNDAFRCLLHRSGEREGVDPAAVRQKLWQHFRRQAICGADVLRPKPGRLAPAVALF